MLARISAAEKSGLAIKEFSSYTNEWADFILANRGNDSRTQIHKYDKEALALVYNSDTYAKLLDYETGLFSQSSAYVYGIHSQELKTGKIQ